MNTFPACKIVIIDDIYDEAEPIIKALHRKGIPVAYFNAEMEELPENPMSDIRLLVLDLNLVTVGDTHSIIRSTIGVLEKVIDPNSKGLGIILWTQHIKEKDMFTETLSEQMPTFKPQFILSLDKIAYKINPTSFSELGNEIFECLEKQPAYSMVLNWEQFVNKSIIHTSSLLLEMSNDDQTLLGIIAAITRAAADSNTLNSDESVITFRKGMNELLLDHVKYEIHSDDSDLGEILCQEINGRREIQRDHLAKINQIIICDPSTDISNKPYCGNIYLWEDIDEHVNDVKYSSKDIRGIINDIWSPPKDKRGDKVWMCKRRKEICSLAKTARLCVVEVTPACDHANKKAKFCRLVLGLLLDENGEKIESLAPNGELYLPAESRNFAKKIPPMAINVKNRELVGNITLILNARHLFTMPLQKLAESKPILRLRHHVLVDIQAWFAAHAARPGFLEVR